MEAMIPRTVPPLSVFSIVTLPTVAALA